MTTYIDGVVANTQSFGTNPDPAGSSSIQSIYGFTGGPLLSPSQLSVSAVALYQNATFAGSLVHFQRGSTYFTLPETSTGRMVDALQLVGFPSSLYGAAGSGSDSGQSQIQAPTSAPTTVKSYLDAIAQAENGIIYARTDGVVVAYDRYHQINAFPTLTFGDNGTTEIPYQVNPQFAKDNVDLFNASTCQAVGGNPQTAIGTTSTQYGVTASLDETNLISAGGDAEMLGRSQWNVSRYETPQMRIRAIDVDCLAHLSLVAPPLLASQPQQSLEIGRQVNVNRRPFSTAMSSLGFGNPMFTQVSMVEGIEHTIDIPAGKWHMTLHLSPADTQQYWVLGTSALDTGTRLAY